MNLGFGFDPKMKNAWIVPTGTLKKSNKFWIEKYLRNLPVDMALKSIGWSARRFASSSDFEPIYVICRSGQTVLSSSISAMFGIM